MDADNNNNREEEAKAIYALIDGRWNAEDEANPIVDGDLPGREPSASSSASDLYHHHHYYSIPLPTSRPNNTNTNNQAVQAVVGPKGQAVGTINGLTTPQQWYEYYARRYPSRGYLEHMEQERRLEEEREHKLGQEERERSGREGGWFWRTFFGGRSSTSTLTNETSSNSNNNVNGNAGGGDDDHGSADNHHRNINGNSLYLEDNEDDDDSHEFYFNDGMCGTTSRLDFRAVTHESIAFHRFHLASERRALFSEPTRTNNNENNGGAGASAGGGGGGYNVVMPARHCVGWQGQEGGTSISSSSDTSFFCVVGYGKIAEFPSSPGNSNHNNNNNTTLEGANVTLTSDYTHLLSLSQLNANDPELAGPPHDLRHCRAACIGRDCLMVSWDRGDGWIVFYKRVVQRPTRQSSPAGLNNQQHQQQRQQQGRGDVLEIGWEVVAAASPSKAVIHTATKNMTPNPYHNPHVEGEEGAEAQERRLYDSSMLFVTDLLPMMVVDGNSSSNNNHGPNQQSKSAVLAVSRLGGYVELLPLPDWIWTPIEPHSSSAASNSEDGSIPNLTATSKTAAFATHQHHLDVMSVDAFRTRVGGNVEWDDEGRHAKHGEGAEEGGPPAELVLAVCGRGGYSEEVDGDYDQGNRENKATVTLWGVATIHAPAQQQHQPHANSAMGNDTATFDVQVRRIGHFSLDNVGADASLFLSDVASDRWIANHHAGGLPSDGDAARMSKKRRLLPCSTITVPAPLVALRFTPSGANRVLLAALDYNGGVSVLDCTGLVHSAEHMMKELTRNNAGHSQISLFCDREKTMSFSSNGKLRGIARASRIEWWPSPGNAAMRHSDEALLDDDVSSFTLASHATVMKRCKNSTKARTIVRLQHWDVIGNENKPSDVFSLPISNSAASSVALLPTSHEANEVLSFLQIPTVPHNGINSTSFPPSLSIRAIQKYTDPAPIISTLLRQGDPTKALEVASKFGGAQHFGGRVMNECRIRLWETQRDVNALKSVGDGRYVVGEALKLVDCRGQDDSVESSNINGLGLTLEDLAEVFKEALVRCNSGHKDDDDGVDTQQPSSEAAPLLRNVLRLLGTFNLLINHFALPNGQTVPSNILVLRFLQQFQHGSLHDIALSVAAKGDIGALTILLARHPISMQSRIKILNCIPLEVDISTYEHWLPCATDCDAKDGKDSLFLAKSGNYETGNHFFDALELFTYLGDLQLLQKRQGGSTKVGDRSQPSVTVFADDVDRENVALHYWEGTDGDMMTNADADDASVSTDQVAMWYLSHAIKLHHETGQLLLIKETCEAGLIRLGFVSFKEHGGYDMSDLNSIPNSCDGSSIVGKLIYLHSAASLFSRILVDKLKEPLSHNPPLHMDSISEWKDIFTSMIQFCVMELSETVAFIVEGSNDMRSSIAMFQAFFADGGKHLEPMGTDNSSPSTKSEDLASRLEHGMMELCLDKVRRLRRGRKMSVSALQDAASLSLSLQQAISMCVDFASFGINSLPSHSGIIQSELSLIAFAENIFYSVLEVTKGEWWSLMTEGVIDQLWSIFELLPSTTASSNGSSMDNEISSRKVRSLHFRLVVLQLCCKWHCAQQQSIPCELWNFMLNNSTCGDREGNKSDNELIKDLCVAGHCMISIMCNGFCGIARMIDLAEYDEEVSPRSSEQDHLDLLFDFVSDIDEFDIRFFSSGVQESGYLGRYLVPLLLSQHSFVMLRNILKIRVSWFCLDFVGSAILSFIRDQDVTFHVALACQEALASIFPYLTVEFEGQRRISDANQFMSEALKLDPHLLDQLVSEIDYSASQVSLVQALVALNPQAILLGCEFWSDGSSASNACADASLYFSSQIHALMNGRPVEELGHVLPPMPGSLVVQLANILGLQSPYDLSLVKCCMVSAALKMGLGPAAAAICYSMLCDAAFSRNEENRSDTPWTSQLKLQVIDCVVASVDAPSFNVIHIKKDMCSLALRLFSIWDASLSHDVMGVFKSLEYQLLTLETSSIPSDTEQPPEQSPGAQHSDFLVFKAAELVARQVRDFGDKSKQSHVRIPRAIECGNNFYDRNLTCVYHNIKQSWQVDMLQLMSSTGGESSSKAISKAIFSWIISEAFKVSSKSYPLPLSTANITMLMEIGASCLNELEGHSLSSHIIKQSLEEFRSKSMLSGSQEHGSSPNHLIQPDVDIIRRLNDRGYGWNAARRAVIMTDNQGYSAALTWAVSHFQDADFDSPMYFLRVNSAHSDQSLVDMTDKLLQLVQCKNEEKQNLTDSAMYDPATQSSEKPLKGKTKKQATGSANSKNRNTTAAAKRHNSAPKIPGPSPEAHTLPIKEGEKHLDCSLNETFISNNRTAPDSPKRAHASFSTKEPYVPNMPGPSTTSLLSTKAGDKHSVLSTPTNGSITNWRPPNSGGSISSVEGSLSSYASVKKQIKLGRTKLGSKKISLEERKKLAIEGKKLLDAARAKNKKVIAPPTSITTSRRAASSDNSTAAK